MTVHQYSHALCSGRRLCCPWPKPAAYQAVAASLPYLVLSTSTLQAHHRRRQLQMHQRVKSSSRSFGFCPCQAAAVAYYLIECRAAAAASCGQHASVASLKATAKVAGCLLSRCGQVQVPCFAAITQWAFWCIQGTSKLSQWSDLA